MMHTFVERGKSAMLLSAPDLKRMLDGFIDALNQHQFDKAKYIILCEELEKIETDFSFRAKNEDVVIKNNVRDTRKALIELWDPEHVVQRSNEECFDVLKHRLFLIDKIRKRLHRVILKSNQRRHEVRLDLTRSMEKFEYPVAKGGQCYGLSHMSMQSFFAHELHVFYKRYHLLCAVQTQNEDKALVHMIQGMSSTEVQQSRVEIDAFFNGIFINQSPKLSIDFIADHDKPPKNDSGVTKQMGEKTIRATLSLALDNPGQNPKKIEAYTGAYSKQEWIDGLNLLKNKIGSKMSFALCVSGPLSDGTHAVNLNFDAQNQRWILINANRLPGTEYIETEFLVDELLSAFGFVNAQGVVVETELYVSEQHAEEACVLFQGLKNEALWKKYMLYRLKKSIKCTSMTKVM